MPTVGELKLNPGTADKPGSGYRSNFSHANEVSQADYYKVKLDASGIIAEMTTSARVGFHQYTFPKTDQGAYHFRPYGGVFTIILIKTSGTYVKVINDSLLVGYRQNQWLGPYTYIIFCNGI